MTTIAERIEHVRATLQSFLTTPGEALLLVRCRPEQQPALMKVAAALEEDARNEVAFFGYHGPFQEPVSFWREVATALAKDLDEAEQQAKADATEEEAGPLPQVAPIDWKSSVPFGKPERRFGSWLESLAREAGQTVVLVLAFESVADAAALRMSLATLAGAVAGAPVRLLVLDDLTTPFLEDVTFVSERRFDRVFRSALEDPKRLFERLLSQPGPRVLGLSVDLQRAPNLQATLADRALAKALGFEAVLIEEPFVDALEWWHAAEVALEDHEVNHLRFSLAPPPARRRELGMEGSFAELAEATARRWLSDGRTLLVVLCPTRIDVASHYLADSLALLAEASTTPAVRYVFVDPGFGVVVPGPAPQPQQAACIEFELSPAALEGESAAAAADPQRSPLERFRHTMILGSFALARQDFAAAVGHCADAIRMAEQLGDGSEQALAWLNLGHTAYRMGDFPAAQNAFQQASTLALDHRADALAAAALTHLGHACFCQGIHLDAIACYRSGERYQYRLGNSFGSAHALTWLGESHRALQQPKEAEQSFRTALGRYETFSEEHADAVNQGKIDIYERLGRLFHETGRGNDATTAREQARALGSTGLIHEQP